MYNLFAKLFLAYVLAGTGLTTSTGSITLPKYPAVYERVTISRAPHTFVHAPFI
jgi:hypothetical protein